MDASELEKHLGNGLVAPGHQDYDQARRVWNGMIDRNPALIARCRGVSDVIRSVRFAREHDLLVAIRGGGHNVAGFATCDGGIVIDLSAMRSVRVEPEKRLARAEGGATWADLDRETQAFGLAAPGGLVSTTGIAGLTLGGGQGWLRRTHGMTCDSLVSADIVTADGRFIRASETENADLYWALRGGGGNFGVVTSFEYRLHPVGPMVAFVGPVYAIQSAPKVFKGFREFMADAPEEINASVICWTLPAAPGFPEPVQGKEVVVVAASYAGSVETGERLLQPLRELDELVLDMSSPMPWTDLQQMFDPFFPKGELRYYWKSLYLDHLGEDVVQTIDEYSTRRPSPLTMTVVWALGGAMRRLGADETATGNRDASFLIELVANWKEHDDDAANITWVREFYQAMLPLSSGKPNVNFPGLGEDAPEFVRAAYGAGHERLVATKRKYDPTNLFCLNQNIDPSG